MRSSPGCLSLSLCGIANRSQITPHSNLARRNLGVPPQDSASIVCQTGGTCSHHASAPSHCQFFEFLDCFTLVCLTSRGLPGGPRKSPPPQQRYPRRGAEAKPTGCSSVMRLPKLRLDLPLKQWVGDDRAVLRSMLLQSGAILLWFSNSVTLGVPYVAH